MSVSVAWVRVCFGVLLVSGGIVGRGRAEGVDAAAPGLDVAAALAGGWTRSGACDRPVHFRLSGDTLFVAGTDGKVDTQRVLERRASGIATETIASAHGNPIGMRWVYEVLSPGLLSLTDQFGRSANFERCGPAVAAAAGPGAFLRGLFAIYVAGDDASLPFASAAGLQAFLVPDLADAIGRYDARLAAGGRIDAPCLRAEPITGAQDDYRVTDVKVDVAEPARGTPDRTRGTVSFRNFGTPATVRFDLRRTAAGWRIDDLHSASTASLRAEMAACAAAR